MVCSPVGLIISHHKDIIRVSIPSQAWIFFKFFLKLLGEDHVHFHNTWYSVSRYPCIIDDVEFSLTDPSSSLSKSTFSWDES